MPLRNRITFHISPLLELALSLLVLQNPERFAPTAPWTARVTARLPAGLLDRLQAQAERVDLFALARELEETLPRPVPELLGQVHGREPDLGQVLLGYWEAIAPEVAANASLVSRSMQAEMARLQETDPLAYLGRFSDRISVDGGGEYIVLHWGKGLRVRLADLERILFVPSSFCPRRLMFYRLGPEQIFFYPPLPDQPAEPTAAPESLVLGFSALSDATRLKLLRLIVRETLPAQEMARELGVNESTVSRHLRLLIEAGLVGRERQEGKYILYSFNTRRLDELTAGAHSYLRGEQP